MLLFSTIQRNTKLIRLSAMFLLQDRFAFKQSRPPIDPQQDWFIISGENMDGYTVLQFSRKWVTCDERDRNILVRVPYPK